MDLDMEGRITSEIDWPAVRRTRHIKRKMKPPKISKAIKYGLAFFNGLFWGLSLLLICVGSISIGSSHSTATGTTSTFNVLLNVSILLIVIGIIMFVISLAGILGSLRENITLLKFYKRCIIFFLVAEFCLAIFCFAFPNRVLNLANRDLPRASIVQYRDDINMQNLLDFLQQRFGCCGVSPDGYRDWNMNIYFNCSEENLSAERCGVPWSCCLEPDKKPIRDVACGNNVQKLTAFEARLRIYTLGCIDASVQWMQEHAYIVAASCVAVAFAQIAVIYQASGIIIILQRMQPKPYPPPARPEKLCSGEMVCWSLRWLTGCWPGPEDDFAAVPASQREPKKEERRRTTDEERERRYRSRLESWLKRSI